MVYDYALSTPQKGLLNITAQVRDAVRKSGVQEGLCVVFCPHTTAGVTINENSDPDVVNDLLFALDRTFPDRPEFRHDEGNSAAHLRSSVIGCSETVIVRDGQLLLGVWQGIYFAESDGPRSRTFYVKVLEG
ncbi:MAG: secondary thiamine-phosphate synthase enzyme YjbQ [Oscillospiraceae bacterium]|nr:secondary thiamine-phosphate synthase enzyme YjbQ [Oscillospiraceae bacterium]